MKRLTTLLLTAAATGLALPAAAQSTGDPAGSWNIPYGGSLGGENRAFDPPGRDANGNRVIVNGRILSAAEASSLSTGFDESDSGSGFGASTAIGNQLNVVTQGSWNTVIVDSTQINNGDVSATVGPNAVQPDADAYRGADVLNGEINLDD